MAKEFPDELPRNRFWLKSAVVLALLICLGFAGIHLYRKWEPVRLTKQARAYFEQGKTDQAVLTAKRALQINRFSEPASRLMAEITEKLKLPDAVDWRQRVSEFNPGSTEDALAWANVAIRQGKIPSAQQALEAVPAEAQKTARYHGVAGATAMAAGRLRDAERHFTEAVRLEPGNELYQYNLATFQIQAGDKATRDQGAATLEKLGKSGPMAIYARRTRLKQLRGEKKDEEALAVSSALIQMPDAEFHDRLEHLIMLHRLNRPEWKDFSSDLKKRAGDATPEDCAALSGWLTRTLGPMESLPWLDQLPAKLSSNPRIKLSRAEALAAAGRWDELKKLASEGSWEGLDFMRLAYLSRALKQSGDSEGARMRWAAAIGAAKRREPLSQLALFASESGSTAELRETLWAAANTPASQWALQMLHRSYSADGDTVNLLRVAQKASESDPKNDAARNNVAALSLLLGRDVKRSVEIAQKLHSDSPKDPNFASTLALGFFLIGKSKEAVSVMEALPDEQLKIPAIAAYYGIVLAGNGESAKAREYLKLVDPSSLLPQEKALVATATSKLTTRDGE